MNSTINDLASLDYKLHLRIAGVGDLIAAEARYHSSCLIEQQRLANKARENVQASDTSNLSSLELCHELCHTFLQTKGMYYSCQMYGIGIWI